MKKSIGLLSALVVTTTFIVNCQKAPEKRRVRPSGGSGVQTDVVKPVPTKACSAQLIQAYTSLYKSKLALASSTITASSSEADKEAHSKMGIETLDQCKKLITSLKAEESEGCTYQAQGKSNALTANVIQTVCNDIGEKLKNDVALDNEFANAKQELKKSEADAKKVESELLGKSLRMSKDARSLVLESNVNGGKYLANGEIGSSTTSMEDALSASKTVCTFLGEGLKIDESKDTLLKITGTQAAAKSDLVNLKEDFIGKSTLLSTLVKQEADESPSTISLLCLNLDPEKLTVEKITSALGKEIASASAQVSTELTGETSEAAKVATSSTVAASMTQAILAAAQPAGSPQAANMEAATGGANGLQAQKGAAQQAAASQTVVAAKPASAAAVAKTDDEGEEGEAIVVTAPAASATVTTVSTATASSSASATVTADAQADAQNLADLKDMSVRLDAEATAAEAELKKLETEKAKESDIEDAKRVARNARESANSAKQKYEEAAKASTVATK